MDMTMPFEQVEPKTTFYRRHEGAAYQKVKSPQGATFGVNQETGELTKIENNEVVRVEKIMVRAYNRYRDSSTDFPCANMGEVTDNIRKAASFIRGDGCINVTIAGLSLYASDIPRGVSTTDHLKKVIESRRMSEEEFMEHPEVALQNSTGEATSMNKMLGNLIANLGGFSQARQFIYQKVLATFKPSSK